MKHLIVNNDKFALHEVDNLQYVLAQGDFIRDTYLITSGWDSITGDDICAFIMDEDCCNVGGWLSAKRANKEIDYVII